MQTNEERAPASVSARCSLSRCGGETRLLSWVLWLTALGNWPNPARAMNRTALRDRHTYKQNPRRCINTPPVPPAPDACHLDPKHTRETTRRSLGLPVASFYLFLCPQAIFKLHVRRHVGTPEGPLPPWHYYITTIRMDVHAVISLWIG